MGWRGLLEAVTRRRYIDPAPLDALLAMAIAAAPERRAQFEAQVAVLVDLLPDPRRMRDVGLLLDVIARGKLYRLGGHTTFDDFLRASVGISRTTAHRLRAVSRAPELAPPKRGKMAIYEAARHAKTNTKKRRWQTEPSQDSESTPATRQAICQGLTEHTHEDARCFARKWGCVPFEVHHEDGVRQLRTKDTDCAQRNLAQRNQEGPGLTHVVKVIHGPPVEHLADGIGVQVPQSRYPQ